MWVIPIIVCAVIASLPAVDVGFRKRIAAGFFLAIGSSLVVNGERNLVRDEISQILLRWILCFVGCMVVFPMVTHGVSRLILRRELRLDRCRKCGYCLFGLIDPRCPECGTPISQRQWDHLAESAGANGIGREKRDRAEQPANGDVNELQP
jgi:ribosomal protein L37E